MKEKKKTNKKYIIEEIYEKMQAGTEITASAIADIYGLSSTDAWYIMRNLKTKPGVEKRIANGSRIVTLYCFRDFK